MKRDPVTIAYLRVSTDKQEIERQQDVLVTYHRAQRSVDPKSMPKEIEIYKDFAVSGRCLDFFNRPEGMRLRRFVSKGDVVIVTEMDRLGRTALDVLSTIDWLEKQGVDVHILNCGGMKIDGAMSPMGRMVRCVLAGVAEMEGYMISKRTKEAFRVRRAAGRQYSKHPPYGHKFEKRQIVDENGKPATRTNSRGKVLAYEVIFVPDFEFRRWAKHILSQHREGFTYAEIAAEMNRREVPVPPHWPAGVWTKRSVYRVLKHERQLEKAVS